MNQFKHHKSIKYNPSPSWPLLESLTVWISLVMILMDSVFLPSFFLSSTRSASCAMSLSVIFYQFYLWIGIWNFLPFFYFVIRNVFLLFFCYIFIFFILLLRFIVILVLFVIVASFFLHRLQNGSWIHIWVYQSSYLRFHSSPRHSSWRHHHPSASIWVWRRLSRQRPRDSSWQPWTFLPGFLWQSM